MSKGQQGKQRAAERKEPTKAAPKRAAKPSPTKDESQERLRKASDEPVGTTPLDGPVADQSHELRDDAPSASPLVDEDELEAEENAEGLPGEADGELPAIRVGEVWESTAPADDEKRRRLKVLEVPEDGGPVRVQNESSYVRSRIKRARFRPGPHGFKRFAS